jgi:hypothetical protein
MVTGVMKKPDASLEGVLSKLNAFPETIRKRIGPDAFPGLHNIY